MVYLLKELLKDDINPAMSSGCVGRPGIPTLFTPAACQGIFTSSAISIIIYPASASWRIHATCGFIVGASHPKNQISSKSRIVPNPLYKNS